MRLRSVVLATFVAILPALALAQVPPSAAPSATPSAAPSAPPVAGSTAPKPAADAPAPAPVPAPEMKQLAFYQGAWVCEGNVLESPFGPAHRTRSAVRIDSDLDGFWVTGSVKEEKTAENTHPLAGTFHQTFDSKKKQFVLIWVDNFGTFSITTSPGWEKDVMTWTGEGWVGGDRIGMRDSFTRQGTDVLVHATDMREGTAAWVPVGTETCRKAVP